MQINVECGSCKTTLKAPVELVGKVINCPKCGAKVSIVDLFDGTPASGNSILPPQIDAFNDSTGLGEKAFEDQQEEAATSAPPADKKNQMLIAAGAVILILVMFLVFGGGDKEPESTSEAEEIVSQEKENKPEPKQIEPEVAVVKPKCNIKGACFVAYDGRIVRLGNPDGKYLMLVFEDDTNVYIDEARHAEVELANGRTYKAMGFGSDGSREYMKEAIDELKYANFSTRHSTMVRIAAIQFETPVIEGQCIFRMSGREVRFNVESRLMQIGNDAANSLEIKEYDKVPLPGPIIEQEYSPVASKMVMQCVGRKGVMVYDPTTKEIDEIDVPDDKFHFCICQDKLVIYEYTINTFKIYSLDTLQKIKQFESPVETELAFVKAGYLNDTMVFAAYIGTQAGKEVIRHIFISLDDGKIQNKDGDFEEALVPSFRAASDRNLIAEFQTRYTYLPDPLLSRIYVKMHGTYSWSVIRRERNGDWAMSQPEKPIAEALRTYSNDGLVPTINELFLVDVGKSIDNNFEKRQYKATKIVPCFHYPLSVGVDETSGELAFYDSGTIKIDSVGLVPDADLVKKPSSSRVMRVGYSNGRRYYYSNGSSSVATQKDVNYMPGFHRRAIYDPRINTLMLFSLKENNILQLNHHIKNKAELMSGLVVVSRPPEQISPNDKWKYSIETMGSKNGITYKLATGPEGLTLNRRGEMSWQVPEDVSGDQKVVVLIKNLSGFSMYHSFLLFAPIKKTPTVNLATGEDAAEDQINNDLKKVNGLVVIQMPTGEQIGKVLEIIVSANETSRSSRNSRYDIDFARGSSHIGSDMRNSLNEVKRLIENRNFSSLKNYDIEFSFGDKYSGKDGGSASAAFALLLYAVADGLDIDKNIAITGDLTVDGTVRPVGGVVAKIKGAIRSGCEIVLIPSENEHDVYDMGLLGGDSDLKKVNLYSIDSLADAVDIARLDSKEKYKEAAGLYAEFVASQAIGGKKIDDETVQAKLREIIKLCPNHLSAQYFLKKSMNELPKVLSVNESLRRIAMIIMRYNRPLKYGNGFDSKEMFSSTAYKESIRMCSSAERIVSEDLEKTVELLKKWIREAQKLSNILEKRNRERDQKKIRGLNERYHEQAADVNEAQRAFSNELSAQGKNIRLFEKMFSE